MKVLITGGSGYLGSVLAADLASAGYQVVCLDVSPMPRGWEFWCPASGNVEFVQGSVCDLSVVSRLVHDAQAIVHAAFLVGGPACDRHPVEARELAIHGTEAVLTAAGRKPVMFVSSDAVYGNSAQGICREDFPCKPASLYGQLKLECEDMIRAAGGHGIIRLPSHFGLSPSMRSDLLVHWLILQVLAKGEIMLHEPEVTRTLIHVKDSAAALRHILEHVEQASGGIFNVGGGAWKKAEIAHLVAEALDGRVVLPAESTKSDTDKRDFTLDCSRIMSLGWCARFDLKQGLLSLRDYINATLTATPRTHSTTVPVTNRRASPWGIRIPASVND